MKYYPRESLGSHDYGWLKAKYHFSFADYHNKERMGFGALRVINDDTIKAGAGFDTHPHKDMEIITYVRSGAITHRDSRGNVGRTEAGDLQVMSAGTGIYHSEFNLESEDTTLFQIWIKPRQKGIEPRWDSMRFPKTSSKNSLPLLVSGLDKSDEALYIHQDATIHGGTIDKGTQINHSINGQAYILLSKGDITLNGQHIRQGDGAEITDLKEIKIVANQPSEILIIDVPKNEKGEK